MTNPLQKIGDLKKIRDQAIEMQKVLAQEKVEINENGVHIIITGDQKIQLFEIQGVRNDLVQDKLNKAIKQSQELAAKKLQSMSGGLGGLKGLLGQ